MQDNTKLQIKFYSRFSSTIQLHHKFITSHTKTKNEIQTRFSKWCENEKRSLNPFSKVMRKRNSYPFFKVMRKRKTKTEIHIRFSKRCENEIRSSKLFFKASRKRKTKSKIQICFSMSCENEKWKWHLNSLFPCHRKTVGTKVHAL